MLGRSVASACAGPVTTPATQHQLQTIKQTKAAETGYTNVLAQAGYRLRIFFLTVGQFLYVMKRFKTYGTKKKKRKYIYFCD